MTLHPGRIQLPPGKDGGIKSWEALRTFDRARAASIQAKRVGRKCGTLTKFPAASVVDYVSHRAMLPHEEPH